MATVKKKKSKRSSSQFKPRKIRIKVVGLGGGGSSIVAEMARMLKGPSFVVADTDRRVFKKVRGVGGVRAVRVFQFGEKLIAGMGTGMNPEIAQQAAIEEKDKIEKIFQGQDLSILIGSLGGGVASGAGPVFAEASRNQKNISLGIFTLPFGFEGEKKMRLAKKALGELRKNLSGIVVVPNEKIFHLIDKKTPLKKALSSLNQVFVNWLSDLIEVILRPNLINIDFADLRTILKDRGCSIYFGQAVAQGQNRAEELIKKIFENPFFDKPPIGAKRILFNITGGKDLTLTEVESVSQNIANSSHRAKIIFGISGLSAYNGRMKLTFLAVSDEEKGQAKCLSGSADSAQKAQKKTAVRKNKKTAQITEQIKARGKKKPRRSALEIQEAKAKEETKEWAGEPEWEIPAFLKNKIE